MTHVLNVYTAFKSFYERTTLESEFAQANYALWTIVIDVENLERETEAGNA